MPSTWEDYDSPGCWDEMVHAGSPRDACEGVYRYLVSLGDEIHERFGVVAIIDRSGQGNDAVASRVRGTTVHALRRGVALVREQDCASTLHAAKSPACFSQIVHALKAWTAVMTSC